MRLKKHFHEVSRIRIGQSGWFGRKGAAINFVTYEDERMLLDIQKFYNVVVEEQLANAKELNVAVASSKELGLKSTLTSASIFNSLPNIFIFWSILFSQMGDKLHTITTPKLIFFSRITYTFSASASSGLLWPKQRHNALTSHRIALPLFALAESNENTFSTKACSSGTVMSSPRGIQAKRACAIGAEGVVKELIDLCAPSKSCLLSGYVCMYVCILLCIHTVTNTY
ncbi:hypothetical protein LguiA_002476 [Lonicera macranthoides]